MDMFKEIPEQFHKQFMNTLDGLGCEIVEKQKKVISIKRVVILMVAVVAALSTITVGATEVYKWHQAAKDRLGVSEEVADKLVMEGAAKEESVVVETRDITIQTIQSVATARGYYLLFSLSTSDGMKVDGDCSFENIEIISEKEFAGITLGMVEDSIQGNTSLWEIELLARENVDYAGVEVMVKLDNLVQTDKTDIVDTLLEGSWELPVILPMNADTRTFYGEYSFSLGIHQLEIYKIEMEPFRVRLYADAEALAHAKIGQREVLKGICYKDGGVSVEECGLGNTMVKNGEIEESCLQMELTNAINVEQVSELVFGENTICLEAGQEQATNTEVFVPSLETVIEADGIEEIVILYVARKGHAIIRDEANVYLWDWECNYAQKLADLEAIGYDEANGGNMVVGANGHLLTILPYETSEQIYIINCGYDLSEEDRVLEKERGTRWESAVQYAYVDEKEYCIVSEDGSIANMRLKEVN